MKGEDEYLYFMLTPLSSFISNAVGNVRSNGSQAESKEDYHHKMMHEIFSMINHCIFMQSRMKTIEEEERKVVYSYELIVEIVSNRHSYMLSTFDNLLSFQPQFLQHV